jgi:hypothetical protein
MRTSLLMHSKNAGARAAISISGFRSSDFGLLSGFGFRPSGLPRSCAALIGVLLAWAACQTSAAPSAADLRVESSTSPTGWTVSHGGQKVLVYSSAPQKFKPYVQELYTLQGRNVLRDAPFDHLHHHALMYGIRVNGINFWEETPGCGVEKVIETAKPVVGSCQLQGQTLPQATLSQTIHWVAPQDAFLPNNAPVALLVEHRTLVLTVNPAKQEVALEWRSQFEVGPKTNTVTLTGANYHGLGMRFPQEFDALAVHSLAGTRPDLSNSRQDVSAVPWAAVSFAAPDHPATVVLAGHPSNLRGHATYFSMLTPFAYLSATQALDKEPVVYHAGDKFELKYLVLVYPDAKPSDTLGQRVEAWRKAKP